MPSTKTLNTPPRNDLKTVPPARSATTCWALVRAAADGETGSRDAFAWRYQPVVRGYLGARWKGAGLAQGIDDAIQEVFLECFREDGALTRVTGGRFRTFLFAVTRNVARRVEERAARERGRLGTDPGELEVPSAEDPLSRVFDRMWAQALVHQARDLMESRARARGERAEKRALLLRLRFNEGRPIRWIARAWGVDAAYLHHEYATARDEFARALRDLVAFHQPGAPEDVDGECARIQRLLRS